MIRGKYYNGLTALQTCKWERNQQNNQNPKTQRKLQDSREKQTELKTNVNLLLEAPKYRL